MTFLIALSKWLILKLQYFAKKCSFQLNNLLRLLCVCNSIYFFHWSQFSTGSIQFPETDSEPVWLGFSKLVANSNIHCYSEINTYLIVNIELIFYDNIMNYVAFTIFINIRVTLDDFQKYIILQLRCHDDCLYFTWDKFYYCWLIVY